MNLMDLLQNSNNGALVEQMAQQLGIDQQTARRGLQQLAPAVSRGFSRNMQQSAGLDGLLQALQGGQHEQYIDNPQQLRQQSTINDGNSILGHIFGSKDVSRNVAAHASQQSGIGADLLKKMLPMIAAAAMGGMAKQQRGYAPQQNNQMNAQSGSSAGGLGGMLSSFLDSDKDGSAVDDLFNIARKFL